MVSAADDLDGHDPGRDPEPGETLTYIARPRSITAASQRIESGDAGALALVPKRPEKWQGEAWTYFDNVPEIKFAGRFNGNALSRLRMFPAIVVDPDSPPVPIQDAVGMEGITEKLARDALDETSRMGDSDAISQHLNEFGVNLTIPGDSYMIVTPETPTEPETWQVYSESAVTKTEKGLALKAKPGSRPEPFPPDTLAIRIWRRHSRWPGLADSNMRSILAEVEELLIYSRQFRAIGKSRNNAGILFLHQDLDLPATMKPGDPPGQLTTLEAGITKSMTTPTFDDASVSSVVPHLVRGRGEPDKMIKHFPLDRKIDDQAIARVTFLIQRCAHGLDTPVEVLTGVADVNHWNAWQIEDQSYRMHLQPLAMVPAVGLARAFLRPALILDGNDPEVVARIVYALDASALTVRPNRSADAKDAFDRLAISWSSYRQHLGFSDTEAPSDEEVMQRALIGLGDFKRTSIGAPGEDVPGLPSGGGDATGGGDTSGGQARRLAIAQVYGFTPIEQPPAAIAASSREVNRRPSDLGHRLAMIDVRLRDRLQLRASEAMNSALRVAGNRLKQKVQGNAVMRAMVKGVDPLSVVEALGSDPALVAAGGDGTSLMDGSFDEVGFDFDVWTRQAQNQVAKLIQQYGGDPEAVQAALERFQRHQEANRDTAKAAFVAGLVALATHRLFTPDGMPDTGEYNARLAVPAGIIRSALSTAGGSSGPGRAPTDVPAATDLGVAGGIALGPDALEAVAEIGVSVDAWEWTVGDPDRPFEPHQMLDGTQFSSFDDPVLANNEAWPPETFFWPGDHDGCECWLVAITTETEVAD